jgi:hypothetical protein
MKIKFSGVEIDLISGGGELAMNFQAIVCPCNSSFECLGIGGQTIFDGAGHDLLQYLTLMSPLKVGEVRVTPGFNLQSKIVHACFSTEASSAALITVLKNCLAAAEAEHVRSIAVFPFDFLGNDLNERELASALIATVFDVSPLITAIERVGIILPNEMAYDVFHGTLVKLVRKRSLKVESV